MDAVLCSLQTGTQESQSCRSRSLRVRLGVVARTAIMIEYYVPQKFRKQSGEWIHVEQRGRIIPFPVLVKKPVLKHFRLAWRRCSISVSLNRPKFTFGFMAWPVLKQSKARFGYDMGRLFLIARRVLALTVISD